nr:hypothetical protein [Tanacetum cinerariifolium]
MVAYLTKSDASEGFNQVIDFLNGSYIKYALTVNPNIYVSCIKQFWNIVAIKQIKESSRKGQNRIKTGQKREAWRSQEMPEAVTVERARKTKENKKRMNENANTSKKLFKFKVKKKREGPNLQYPERSKRRD